MKYRPGETAERFARALRARFGLEGAIRLLTLALRGRRVTRDERALWMRSIELLTAREAAH